VKERTTAERIAYFDKRQRAVKLARTYTSKAGAMVHADDVPFDPWYQDLLVDLLDCAEDILTAVGDDYFETQTAEDYFNLGTGPVSYRLSDDAQERVEKLVELLRQRRDDAKRKRRIELLENVEGRTPEEAQAHLAKAAELRAKEGVRNG
jgi:hypothetical protein